MRYLNPEGWPRPKGYSNGISAEGRMVFVAGMIGWDTEGRFEGDIASQFAQTLQNTVDVLEAGGATAADIVRMTWYVKDLDAYRNNLGGIGAAYRRIIGKHFPVMAVVGVQDLVEPDALIEIETTAVIAESS